MRLDINLAREPFRNRSLLWVGIAFAYIIVLAVGGVVVARSGDVDGRTVQLEADVEKQTKEIAEKERQLAEKVKSETAEVLTTEDVAELDAAHQLITRKSLSWSRLLAELETYIPKESKLTSVSIDRMEGRGPRRVAHLSVTAVGRNRSQPAEMLANFDGSGGRFAAEPVSIDAGQGGGEFSYSLKVDYRPGIGEVDVAAKAAGEPAEDEDE